MDFLAYRALPGLNWSMLKHLVLGSPLHYRHALDSPDDNTTGRLIGRAVHALVLEGREDFAVWDGDRRGKAWQEYRDAHAGVDILRATEAATVRAMAEAVLRHPHAVAALEGQREVSLTWERGGRACKGRLDCLTADGVTDLKSTGPLRMAARTAWASGYVHQLAWYRYGADVDGAYIVGVEAKAPHDVGVWEIDPVALSVADRQIDEALEVLARCEASGVWPGVMPDVEEMTMPAWADPASGMEEMEIGDMGDFGGEDV